MTNYDLEAGIAREMDELLKGPEPLSVEHIRKVFNERKCGPRHLARFNVRAATYVEFLLRKLEEKEAKNETGDR